MRHPESLLAALVIALSLSATAAPVLAQAQTGNYGRVTAFNRPQIRLFDANGSAVGRVDRNELNPGATIVDIRPGGGLGLLIDGQVRYVRGIDVEFELNSAGAARCAPASGGAVRAEGQISTGTYAGGGSSTDCRLGGS